MLPWLKGWRHELQQPVQHIIPAGQFVETFHVKGKSGYILGLSGSADQPTATLEAIHFGPRGQERRVAGSPFALNAGGINAWNGSGFFCPVYNAILGVYVAVFMPDARVGYWVDEFRLRVLASAVATTTVTYHHNLIVIEDAKAWKKSLHQFFQTNIFYTKKVDKLPEEVKD